MVNGGGVDYAGFVFASSKRQVTAEQAALLRQQLADTIGAVGVFVDAPVEEVAQLYRRGIIQLMQLHGQEDATYIRQLRQLVGRAPIIRAVRVRTGQDILEAQALDCDYLLLDTYVPGVAGGSGRQFDYSQIPPLEKPFFLAGGLHPDNVEQAVAMQPYAVDVSSGVETDGYKDVEKIRRFTEKVHAMAQEPSGIRR